MSTNEQNIETVRALMRALESLDRDAAAIARPLRRRAASTLPVDCVRIWRT